MEKRNLKIAAILLMSAIANVAAAQIENNEGVFAITSGDAVLTVDANRGAKITSLQINGKEALAQHKKIEGVPFENPNDYGSTFWPSPQSEWNWPPIATYDRLPYQATVDGDILTLVSSKDAKYPYVVTKTIRALGNGAFQITYGIANASDAPVSVAPWEITRVASGGKLYFEADDITPADEVEYVSEGENIAIYFTPAPRNRKIFADAKGWITHENNGLRFTKSFPDIDAAAPAPGEAEVEVYYNQGETYTEVENQGAYATIQPGESIDWPVVWTITEL